ncbi:MAG: MG2 domain-containing protein, partial [Verrucomicrobia bacterium]|nr:MG2 domain-containing protein [Verrucomicrobiota bacterium]
MRLLTSFLLVLASALSAHSAPRDAQWQQVSEYFDKDRPKSAIKVLTTIDQQARAEKAWPEAIRATAEHALLEDRVAGGRDSLGRIKTLDAELATAPKPMRLLLQTIQAIWLARYFDNNRWSLLDRTPTAGPTGDDIQTWDLKRILTEVGARFNKVLANRDVLRKIPITDYDFILEKEEDSPPDSLRPTLYDFLMHEILDFHATQEQTNAEAEDAFAFDYNSPAFGTTAEFLAWQPQTTDQSSWKLKSLRIYQELLEFHQADLPARVHVDLLRLAWAKNAVSDASGDKRMEQRLREIISDSAGNEVQSLARADLAWLLVGEKRMLEAREIASAGRDAFPDSTFSSVCVGVIDKIEAKECLVSTELVWNAAKPQFEVQYRNLTKIWFRLYQVTWQPDLQKLDRYATGAEADMKRLLTRKPVREWSVDLAPTADYLSKTTLLAIPPDLPKGYYELVSSTVEGFPFKDNHLQRARIWISDLAIVTRSQAGILGGWVTDALSGEPVKGAKVELWLSSGKSQKWNVKETVETDGSGCYSFTEVTGKAGGTGIVRVLRQGDSLATEGDTLSTDRYLRSDNEVFLFTDRAIYRPGQTIRFKGIAASFNRKANDYHSRNRQPFEVKFLDGNRKEIATLKVRSNDFGSFSGSFTAPTDRVLGQAILECEKCIEQVRIEEYKRPKFIVEVGAAKDQPKLGEKVAVTAKATAYTGAAIDGAKVKWSVTRDTEWPDWAHWCGWYRSYSSSFKQIAHGEMTTKQDGSLVIEFLAEPDPNIDPAQEPVFSYDVTVEVTDGTGETRTDSRAIKVGYRGVRAKLTADAWQETAKPVMLTVSTTTVDDQAVAAKGTVTIHRVSQPATMLRPHLPARIYYGDRDQREIKDPADPNTWELGEVVQKNDFATDKEGKGRTEVKLSAGEYRAVLATTDAAGNKVSAILPLRVIDPEAPSFPVGIPYHFAAKSKEVLPGGEFVALWGTGYEHGRVYFEIENRGKLLRSGWSDGTKTQELLRFPVTEAHRGGFQVHAVFVHDNRSYTESFAVAVPWNEHDLTLKFESMRSKLEPGSKETWSVLVEGAEKNAVEMLGTMYDASLEAFAAHNWLRSFTGYFHVDDKRASLQGVGGMTLGQDWGRYSGSQGGYSHPNFRHLSYAILEDVFNSPDAGSPGLPQQNNGGVGAADPFCASSGGEEPAKPDLTTISARKNLQETAFFEPHLTTDDKGIVKMTFTMPEALTKWRFMGFAHDAKLRSGYLEGETVTAKDLMAQPNP